MRKIFLNLFFMIILSINVYSACDLQDLQDSTLLYYKLEENTTDYNDETGNLNLTAGTIPDRTTGIIDFGQDFENSNNNYIETALDSIIEETEFTYNFWVNLESTPSIHRTMDFLTDSGGNYYGCEMSIRTNDIDFLCYEGNLNYHRSRVQNEIYANTDYMITIIKQASNGEIDVYIDGTETSSYSNHGNGTVGYLANNHKLVIGNRVDYSNGFDGVIDEFSFFNKELSQDCIDYLYNSGSPDSEQQYPYFEPSMYLNIEYPNINSSISSWNGSILVYSNTTIDKCSINNTDFKSTYNGTNYIRFDNKTGLDYLTYYFYVNCTSGNNSYTGSDIYFYVNYFQLPQTPEDEQQQQVSETSVNMDLFIILFIGVIAFCISIWFAVIFSNIFIVFSVLSLMGISLILFNLDYINNMIPLILLGIAGILAYITIKVSK